MLGSGQHVLVSSLCRFGIWLKLLFRWNGTYIFQKFNFRSWSSIQLKNRPIIELNRLSLSHMAKWSHFQGQKVHHHIYFFTENFTCTVNIRWLNISYLEISQISRSVTYLTLIVIVHYFRLDFPYLDFSRYLSLRIKSELLQGSNPGPPIIKSDALPVRLMSVMC